MMLVIAFLGISWVEQSYPDSPTNLTYDEWFYLTCPSADDDLRCNEQKNV